MTPNLTTLINVYYKLRTFTVSHLTPTTDAFQVFTNKY